MFFRQRDIVGDLLKEAIEDAEIMARKKEQVKCADCGAYIDEINEVTKITPYGSIHEFHCGKCRKPYNRVIIGTEVTKYFGEIEMNKEGEPVGYIKSF